MKIKIIVTGKTANTNIKSMLNDYLGRLVHYGSVDYLELNDNKRSNRLTFAQQKEQEGRLIISKLEKSDEVILLDEGGKSFSSIGFAEFIEKRNLHSNRDIVFVVGGAYGFSEEMYRRADSKLSLSDMTFSHQMVRMIFVEQLYRAFTIIKGEPYHHE